MNKQLQIKPLKSWLTTSTEPLIISGPCSVENKNQLFTTARALSKIENVKMIRAGIWKPRTRPDGFEGIGEIGLQWLLEIKKEIGIKTCVEVATPEHITLALKYQVDAVWIGARTTANPFSVQALADCLVGVDIPVMIKNPIHPDLKLWIGAIERINKAGIDKIAAIHRGFYSYENKEFRNPPMWEIPIELKRLIPNLPIICDPSHIGGKRSLLASISQQALDLNISGLMIESHFNPEIALTDADQQITPQNLQLLINNLIEKKEFKEDNLEKTLEKFRLEIDKIDHELLCILGKRNEISKKIGEYKKQQKITVLQMSRLQEMVEDRLEFSKKLDLDPNFILKLLQLVHKESIRIQSNNI